MSSAPNLSAAVRGVLRRAVETFRDEPETEQWLRTHLERLDEPLRVAIAGKVKAGKSTLLNALVGEQIAPTDAGECTRVVTWYRDGYSPKITLYSRDGVPTTVPVKRADGALEIDLQGNRAPDLERLVIDWPSQHLRVTTLIDTPGIASTSAETSQRTVSFLTPEDDAPAEADAVIYLMRHLHAADAQFLESFRDQGVARAASVNTIAVLSRADEVGAGRLDALISARFIARRYQAHPTLRGLCQNVVAVAGLLGQTGRTLRRSEFLALVELARAPRDELDALLLSADRLCNAETAMAPTIVDAVPAEARRSLLARFGLFGIRLSTTLIRQGIDTPGALAEELVRRSGLAELREVLETQFTERRDLLKARSGLLALERVLRRDTEVDTRALEAEVERILASAHEFVELRTLTALRSGSVPIRADDGVELERLLGGTGDSAAVRLGLDGDADADKLRQATLETLVRWQRRAESPLAGRAETEVYRIAVRSCEGLLDALGQ